MSDLFQSLARLFGIDHLQTTAYHPAANGMVERFHRQLKSAIECHESPTWVDKLPIVMLGFRAAFKEDIKATTAEMVYGETIRLPGEFLAPRPASNVSPNSFIDELRRHFRSLQAVPALRQGTKATFVYKELLSASHVFIRRDAVKLSLQQPYEGPFAVVKRTDKFFVINIRGKDVTVSIDRLKPAFLLADDYQPTTQKSTETPLQSILYSLKINIV